MREGVADRNLQPDLKWKSTEGALAFPVGPGRAFLGGAPGLDSVGWAGRQTVQTPSPGAGAIVAPCSIV